MRNSPLFTFLLFAFVLTSPASRVLQAQRLETIDPDDLALVMTLAGKHARETGRQIPADAVSTVRALRFCPRSLRKEGAQCYEIEFRAGLRPRSGSQEPLLRVVIDAHSGATMELEQ